MLDIPVPRSCLECLYAKKEPSGSGIATKMVCPFGLGMVVYFWVKIEGCIDHRHPDCPIFNEKGETK